MIRLINVPRYTLIVSFLLVFILFLQMADAKHIIVIYDVSGSMVTRDKTTGISIEPDDIRRVNEYLTGILFTNTSQDLRDKVNDTYIKECDAAFVGKPLYQSGDILTYAKYAKKRDTIINREQVSRDAFQRQLPTKFPGQLSFLNRAKVEVYDELYRKSDGETYWIFVTDGIPDDKEDTERRVFLQRLAEIEKEYINPMIFGICVKKRIKIRVRWIEELDKIKDIFVSNRTSPNESAQKIQISKGDEGKFISETITVKTLNPKKSKFKLNSVNVEVVDKLKKPVQIKTEDNTSGVIEIPPVLFNDNPPPSEFRIPFPTQPEILAQGNLLKLEVTYNYDGKDAVYSAPLMKIEPAIIYVSSEVLNLNFSEGTYHVDDLVIQSENLNKKAFQIDHIRCHIQDRHGQKLCDATVPKVVERLDKPFSVVVPKQDNLDWYGNKVVLKIDYKYDKEAKSETIEIPYKLVGGSSGFPVWLLWVFLVPVLGVVFFLLVRKIIDWTNPRIVEHKIMLTIEDATDGLVPNDKEPYTLTDKNSLVFGANDAHELHFDVGWPDCPNFLRCERNSVFPWSKDKGRIRHHKSIDDTKGAVVNPPETLTLKRDEDNIEVRIQYDKEDNALDTKSDDKSFKGSTEHVDPLKV